MHYQSQISFIARIAQKKNCAPICVAGVKYKILRFLCKIQGTLNIQVPTFFQSYFFDIYDPCTSFFYKVTPWKQLFYACGLIFIVRHIQQQGVEIMIDVQVIGFRCFYETQYNGTCCCSISSIMKQKVFTPRHS